MTYIVVATWEFDDVSEVVAHMEWAPTDGLVDLHVAKALEMIDPNPGGIIGGPVSL